MSEAVSGSGSFSGPGPSRVSKTRIAKRGGPHGALHALIRDSFCPLSAGRVLGSHVNHLPRLPPSPQESSRPAFYGRDD